MSYVTVQGKLMWDHPEHPDGSQLQTLMKRVQEQPQAVTVLTAHPSAIPMSHVMGIES